MALYNENLFITWYENPISINGEQQKVVNGRSMLDYIPSEFYRVVAHKQDGTQLYEIKSNVALQNSSQFKVDYSNGFITFYSNSHDAEFIVFNYTARGIIKINANRVVTKQNPDHTVAETLDELIDAGEQALEAVGGIQTAITTANLAIATIESDIETANEVKGELNTSVTTANTSKTNLDTSIINSVPAKNNLDTSITNSTTAKDNLDTSIITATNTNTSLTTTIGTANTAISTLEIDISNAETTSNLLVDDINTGNTLHTTLSSDISTASTSKTNLETSITDSATAKTNLDNSISTANTTKTNLDGSISTASTSKTNLDTSITNAGTSKTNLDGSISTGNTLKTNLDNDITTGNALHTTLTTDISVANTAKTNLETIITDAENINTTLAGNVVNGQNKIQEMDDKITEVNGIEVELIATNAALSTFEPYNSGTTYHPLNRVYYNGSTYECKVTTIGNAPPSPIIGSDAYWQIVSKKGQDGLGTIASVDSFNIDIDAQTDVDGNVLLTLNSSTTSSPNKIVKQDINGKIDNSLIDNPQVTTIKIDTNYSIQQNDNILEIILS